MRKKYSKLEKEKIKLEIDLLKKKWWKKSEYYRIIVPIFFGIISLIYAFSSGLIDKQRLDLIISKKQLRYDIGKFNDKKDSLNILNKKLIENYNITLKLNQNLKKESDSLNSILLETKSKIDEVNNRFQKSLKTEYKLNCDLHINKLTNKLQGINGTIWYDGMMFYRKVQNEYFESEEYKNRKKQIDKRTDLNSIEKIDSYYIEYTKTKHYKENLNRVLDFHKHLRDSLFNSLISESYLTKCNERFIIGSSIPTLPNIKQFNFEKEKNDDTPNAMKISNQYYIYLNKK